ncbi:hypothetical protein M569_08842, partial [Genlisea aurea]
VLCFVVLRAGISVSAQNQKPIFACDVSADPALKTLAFCDSSLDVKTRVDDLVNRLTLPEKLGWLANSAKGVSRLGIPDYEWWSEVLHGVSYTGPGVRFTSLVPGATSFPQVILTSASFNESLFRAIGKVVSTEARAMYNVGSAGLTFWSPNVNIFRDPRWGRGQETPGEDPLLTSKYGVAYVRGLQERDDGNKEKLKVASCCKHYTAYDLDNWKGIQRYSFNAIVTQQDLDDTFNPPFKSCVIDGNVASVMCSYNQVNGKPACGDPDLLSATIRGTWKLNGYIVSDCDSLNEMFYSQHYTKTPEETVALAINSGLDLNCGSFLTKNAQAAVDRGLLNETSINKAVANNFATLMRLGFFDGDPSKQLYGNLGPKDVCTQANRELAREAARQGIVLLKNSRGSLPLSPSGIKSLALIGPNVNATYTMIGSYEGVPCGYTSPLQALSASVKTIYEEGCGGVSCTAPRVDAAKAISAGADAVILIMGSDQTIERESQDRVNITLPGQQQLLVTEVAKVAKGPVILVIMSGGGMDIQFAKNDPKISSILWVGFPGEAGGAAISDVIFGSHNPSGKLPMTWYPQSYADAVSMTNMNMRPSRSNNFPGRTYRFYTGPTVYPFGYGLSYTQFSHKIIQAPPPPTLISIPLDQKHPCRRRSSSNCTSIDSAEVCNLNLGFDLQLKVRNEGGMGGSHTVLLFVSTPRVHDAPEKRLLGFDKLHLGGWGEGVARFRIDVCEHLSVVDEFGKRKLGLGEHVLHVGGSKHSFNVAI